MKKKHNVLVHCIIAISSPNYFQVTVDCKDTPGFIVNRLLVPYLMEAVRMVERGDASVK